MCIKGNHHGLPLILYMGISGIGGRPRIEYGLLKELDFDISCLRSTTPHCSATSTRPPPAQGSQ